MRAVVRRKSDFLYRPRRPIRKLIRREVGEESLHTRQRISVRHVFNMRAREVGITDDLVFDADR
jgi:hypothetical protein